MIASDRWASCHSRFVLVFGSEVLGFLVIMSVPCLDVADVLWWFLFTIFRMREFCTSWRFTFESWAHVIGIVTQFRYPEHMMILVLWPSVRRFSRTKIKKVNWGFVQTCFLVASSFSAFGFCVCPVRTRMFWSLYIVLWTELPMIILFINHLSDMNCNVIRLLVWGSSLAIRFVLLCALSLSVRWCDVLHSTKF